MKIIVVMPVKNEEWILEKSLACASLLADYIIVADQNSTDRTPEICRRFPKVIYIDNSSEKFNEDERRKILLNKAREFDGNNLIFALDADEILSAHICDKKILEKLINQIKPGMSVMLQWIMLWKNSSQYRYDDSADWSNNWKNFVYWDDRRMSFDNIKIHSSRVPVEAVQRAIKFNELKVLHYQFVSLSRVFSKQCFYQIIERTLFPDKMALTIGPKYKWYLKEPKNGAIIKDIPSDWLQLYREKGIDLENFPEPDFYWYDREILRFFKQYDLSYFKWLDIWDIDWEAKRQAALKRGIAGLPEREIKDPRPFYIKFYHRYLQPFFGYNSSAHKVYKFLKKVKNA